MNVQPLFASSVFSISPTCEVYQVLNYDYLDPDGEYKKILKNEQAFQNETRKLRANMTAFLETEKVYINNHRVEQQIIHVDIGLRGSSDLPYFQWVIQFQGPSQPKKNVLKSDVEEEITEYDIEVLYLFPTGTRITRVITPMEYEIREPLLLVWARKGDKVGGHEEVTFEFPSTGN
ncbi:MAG: hypothetical protein ACFFD8_05650 [Candidatus Thorarchaeota archaeon]